MCLATLLAAGAWADEASDRAAIQRVFRQLNAAPGRAALFTADADGRQELEAAIRAPRVVRTSSEPLSGDYWPFWPDYLRRPWVVTVTSIRFITPDVALAEASVKDQPLLLVFKREEAEWKIASVRALRL